ncbi:unannotated protein [freshwater metagenome]|uniref:Unannotated protein n=1 Tax=freshwater metagenome TaxID=449393 RepID=A0A6J7IGR8_9ZZZZ
MHESGAVVDRDVVGKNDVVGIGNVDEIEGPLVGQALEFRPLEAREFGEAVAEKRRGECRGDDDCLAVEGPNDRVVGTGIYRDGRVRHEGPRRGGPHEERGRGEAIEEIPVGDRKPHVDGWVDDGLVSLCKLVIREAGTAAWAVGRDPVILDEEALVVDLLERPPDALHVVGVHGPVGAVEIDPVAHPSGHVGELVDVA